jgi:hypothetical protein
MDTHRKKWVLFGTIGTGVLLACGSNISNGNDAGADGDSDATVAADAMTDGGVGDVETSGDAMDDGDSADAPPATIKLVLKCAEASQCEAGTPVCCATLTFGTFGPTCLLDEVSSTCTTEAACPTSLQPFCGGSERVRMCDQNADCTESAYDKCCTFQIPGRPNSPTSMVFCASQSMAEAADASCLP